MYALLISGAVGLLVTISMLVFPEKPAWILGPFFGMLAFVPLVMLITRKIGEKVRPLFETAQQQMKAGNVAAAVATLEKALVYQRWQIFLAGQVHSQIGLLLYASGDERKAVEHLQQGYARESSGHLVLAAA